MTIWEAFAERLGRQPTNKEASDEVRRILREAREGIGSCTRAKKREE